MTMSVPQLALRLAKVAVPVIFSDLVIDNVNTVIGANVSTTLAAAQVKLHVHELCYNLHLYKGPTTYRAPGPVRLLSFKLVFHDCLASSDYGQLSHKINICY